MDPSYLQDLFAQIGPITVQRMFGGQGIFSDGTVIAVVSPEGDLCLKGDALSSVIYEASGMSRWRYTQKKTGKTAAMPYWRVPDSAFDDPDEMARLATLAYDTAQRTTVSL